MKKFILILVILASSLFARHNDFYDYAKVRYSEPIYEYVYEDRPQTQCKDVTHKVRVGKEREYSNDSLGIDTLVGVAAGAVLGSQVGKGNGRVAAQIVGGLLGGKVAHEIRESPSYERGNRYKYVTQKECYETYTTVKRKVLTGYKNYFKYKGKEYSKVTREPKKRIRITHTINF
ncbi:hypothetical protein CP965_01630 [Halarcobacter mediterraneus]|uniref:Glycine zipper 2TM domain-containing protein n=1 Tax=Halarcobacter mediterraneus TaxID=2023153 RepID=A0A4Q1AVF9_9BACT|nr:glycine zipper 2TM domain-containing protein [Halarcobacter mediterraneus]RXK14174.1 hypothetical protein CP965_01630 [Halarcobacter mediterraneus]